MTEETRVLIVDDERRILELFKPLLEDFGYYVRTAATPDDALRLVSEDTFHISFVDQYLGPMKGLELIGKMKVIDPEIYFVIMTACVSADLAVESLKNGASDFLSKPFFINDFIKSINYVNNKRALDREKIELIAALEFKADEKEEELKKMYFSVLYSLAQAMEKKDMGTYGHSKRVSYYSRLIAATLDLGEQDREGLKAASLLHDIGKIGISDFILGKNGRLSIKEMQEVKKHPIKGVEILKPLKQFGPILPTILHHHENYDGSGYPEGLAGEDIPFLARIIAVADTYDAILSNRPYRAARTNERALEELITYSGRQFDPVIVKAFVYAQKKYSLIFGESDNFHPEISPGLYETYNAGLPGPIKSV
jgi:putative nucleotidyltransferase with HDIG domain